MVEGIIPRIKSWRKEIKDHKNWIFISILFLILAGILNQVSGNYVEKRISSPSDLILDTLPTVNLSFLFVWGFLFVNLIFLVYPLFFDVKKLSLVIGQYSLLSIVRSFFISLTHLTTPLGASSFHAPALFLLFDTQNALFFSGHTGFPFLGYLIFRKQKIIGTFFLISTSVMAATVLFMHVHYSIDVFAALFITYGCYKIGGRLFK